VLNFYSRIIHCLRKKRWFNAKETVRPVYILKYSLSYTYYIVIIKYVQRFSYFPPPKKITQLYLLLETTLKNKGWNKCYIPKKSEKTEIAVLI